MLFKSTPFLWNMLNRLVAPTLGEVVRIAHLGRYPDRISANLGNSLMYNI